MDAANASSSSAFTSVLAGSSKYGGGVVPPQLDYVFDAISAAGPWTLLLTLFAMCVVYDQRMLLLLPDPRSPPPRPRFPSTAAAHMG